METVRRQGDHDSPSGQARQAGLAGAGARGPWRRQFTMRLNQRPAPQSHLASARSQGRILEANFQAPGSNARLRACSKSKFWDVIGLATHRGSTRPEGIIRKYVIKCCDDDTPESVPSCWSQSRNLVCRWGLGTFETATHDYIRSWHELALFARLELPGKGTDHQSYRRCPGYWYSHVGRFRRLALCVQLTNRPFGRPPRTWKST